MQIHAVARAGNALRTFRKNMTLQVMLVRTKKVVETL